MPLIVAMNAYDLLTHSVFAHLEKLDDPSLSLQLKGLYSESILGFSETLRRTLYALELT